MRSSQSAIPNQQSAIPMTPREFAIDVVRQLRRAGYEALWAGGCVRDQLLGLTPKDYDVATSARPEQIRELFGRKRTLAIGAAFGVITVLGPKSAGQIEVATFRCDGAYLDGRHPQSVTFSTAELDAQRRDFTINGLFYDPLADQVIDYIGGRDDLQRQIIRAIRNPHERFDEDKLRMLRAVRFAATFGFSIEPATMAAIQELAGEIVIVSAERIATELRRMLTLPRRAWAVELLHESGLLLVILPESSKLDDAREAARFLSELEQPSFATALAVLLGPICGPHSQSPPETMAQAICRRWKLKNDEIEIVCHLLRHESAIRAAPQIPWPQLQRILIAPHREELLAYASAVCRTLDGNDEAVQFCRQKLALPPDELNPLPLLTGDDLKRLGLPPGPAYKNLLDALRDAQLARLVQTREQAVTFIQQRASAGQ
jgi:tRNA nucleotidyltransferase/poly(A) polymerase